MIRKTCPLSNFACKHEGCGWFSEEDGKCAIALIHSDLYWLARVATTKPYETEEPRE